MKQSLLTTVGLALCMASVPLWAGEAFAPGVPNFHKVNDLVYRGGQPGGTGWKSLADLGVKTVLDLRRPDEHSVADEARAVKAAGMRYINIPMKGIVAPSDGQILKALELLDSGEPVFVHCKEGKDRTGTVIACYRMTHDGWNNKQAQKEANSHGMHWFEVGMKSYLSTFRPPVQNAERAPLTPAAVTAEP